MQDTSKRKIIDVVVVLLVIFSLPIVWLIAPRHKQSEVVVINCSISEFSPDFTIEMREACRQARANNISKDLQKPK